MHNIFLIICVLCGNIFFLTQLFEMTSSGGWISNSFSQTVYYYTFANTWNTLLFSFGFVFFFSHTFQRIKENSEKLWDFEMYTVTNDFEWRPITPFLLYPLEAGYRAYQCRRKSKKSLVWI